MPKKSVAVTLRKPQAPADIDGFVEGPKAPGPGAAAPANPLDAAAEVQHGARSYRETTLYLPTDVVRDLAFYCMDRDRDANSVVAEAVRTLVTAPAAAPEVPASTPPSSLRAAFEDLVEQSRLKLNTLWALRRLGVRGYAE